MNVTPTIFTDYTPSSEIDTLLSLMDGCSISHEEPDFYSYSLPRIQAILLVSCQSYNQKPDVANFSSMVHALLAYVICLNTQEDEEVPALFPPDFIELLTRPSTRTDVALDARVAVWRKNNAAYKHNKHEEWKCLLQVVSKLASATILEPMPLLISVLASYKQHAKPSMDALGFALCRLSELLYRFGYEDIDLAILHRERMRFLEAFSHQEPEFKIKIYLLSKVLKEDPTHPINISGLQVRWVDALRDFEADFLVSLVVDPSFCDEHRQGLFDLCEGAVKTPQSLRLADRIKTEIILQKVPLQAFLNSEDITSYLDCLKQVLQGKKHQKFSDLCPRRIQANFLLLLACSATERYSHCLTLLLLALPYCIHHLGGICTDELSASLSGSEDDITYALLGRVEDFLEQNQTQENPSNQWPSVNQVLRCIASSQVEEPLVLLKRSLLTWHSIANPDCKTMALAVRVCADFAHGLTRLEDSVRAIAYTLLESLVEHDEKLLKKSQSATSEDPLFIIKVFYWVLNGYAEHPLNGKNPSWTEDLEGQELEMFAEMANSTRAKEQAQSALFSYYTRKDATDKSLLLAVKIAPSLSSGQLIKLASKLHGPTLDLLVDELNAPTFPETSKSALFWHLYKQNTVFSLTLATRMYNIMGLSRLMLLLKALDKLVPYSIGSSPEHQHMLHCLVHSTWLCDTEITLYTPEDPKAVELIALICALADRFWQEADITQELCKNKIKAMIGDVIRARQRSPSPQPELLPHVLRKSASKLLFTEAREVQESVILSQLGTSKSPGSPDPLEKN